MVRLKILQSIAKASKLNYLTLCRKIFYWILVFCGWAKMAFVLSTPGKLKDMPDHSGNRTYNLIWNASPILGFRWGILQLV